MSLTKNNKYITIIFWLGLTVAVIALRLPSYVDAFFDPDVAASVYSAQLFPEGSCIYPDAVETKPPGSYALLALFLAVGKNMQGVHILLSFYHLLVAFFLFLIAKKLHSQIAGWSAAVLYGFFSAGGFVNGFAPNFETWAMLPLAALAWIIVRYKNENGWVWPLLAGVLAGTATLMKQQAVLVVFGLAIAAVLPDLKSANSRKFASSARLLFQGLIGFSSVWLVTLGYFGIKGCGGDLLMALNPLRNAGYMISNRSGDFLPLAIDVFTAFSKHVWFLLIASLVGLYFIFNDRNKTAVRLSVSWLVGSLLAVMAGTKFFPHYFFFLLLPLAVLGGMGIGYLNKKFPYSLSRVGLLLFVILGLVGCLWREIGFSTISARQLAKQGDLISGQLFLFNARLGPPWLNYAPVYAHLEWEIYARQAGRYIRENSAKTDTLLVYDYLPSVYWFADRKAPTRHHMNFEVAYELPDDYGRWHMGLDSSMQKNRDELLRDLTDKPPKYIVRFRYPRPAKAAYEDQPLNVYGNPMPLATWRTPLFDELATFIKTHYTEDMSAPKMPLLVYKLSEK